MVTAIVLIGAETSRIPELADGISNRIRHLDRMVATKTVIAFRADSKKELEAGFGLGLD